LCSRSFDPERFAERLEKVDAIGLIYWPKKEGGMPQGKRLLEDALGIPLQDV